MALIYILINIKEIKIGRITVALFFISLMALPWAFFSVDDDKLIYKTLAFPYALILYIFINNTLTHDIVQSTWKYGKIYMSVVTLQYFFPSIYVMFFENMVRVIKIKEMGGTRGVSALTSEPSFTAMVLFTFILVIWYTAKKVDYKTIFMVIFLSLGIFVTKSITGYLFLFAFLLYEGIRRLDFTKSALIACALVGIFFLNLEEYRAISFIYRAAEAPENILYESSLFFRVYYTTYGFTSLYYNPLGTALGSVGIPEIKAVVDSFFLGHTFPHLLAKVYPGLNMPSTLGMGLMQYGLFYLVFYLFAFLPIYIKTNVPFMIKVLIFALTAQSFSFAFPLLWFLVVMSEHNLFYDKSNSLAPNGT